MISEEKKLKRNEIKKWRKNMPQALREEYDRAVFENIKKSGELFRHSIVLCYISTDIEVDTKQLLAYCQENSIKTAVPRCIGKRKMEFYFYDKDSSLEITDYGIYEPVPGENIKVTDYDNALCIVPALAYDRKGFRLGYGGGFYDTFIEEHETIFTMGICYSENIIDEIPKEIHDKCVDILVTDKFTEALSNG